MVIIPLALITGPFLSDLFVILSSIVYLIIFFKKKIQFTTFEKKLFLLFSIFYFYLIFNSLISANVYNSLESSLFFFRFFIFVFAGIYCFKSIHNSKTIFRNVLLLTIIILFFDSFFQYFNGYNLLGFEYKPPRLSSFFNTELILGSYTSKLLPVLLALIFIDNNNIKDRYLLLVLTYLVFLIVVILSGERSSFVRMILIGLFILSILPISNFKKIQSLFFLFFFITIIFFIFEETYNRLINYTIVQIYIDGSIQMSPQHSPIYNTAIKIFSDYPLFGIGPKNFRIFCDFAIYFHENGCTTHPHNYYLQFLTETGLIGFIFILLSFFYFSYLLIKHSYFQKEKNFYLIFLILSVFIMLWPLVPTGNFFNNWNSVLHFIPIGMIFAELNVKKNI